MSFAGAKLNPMAPEFACNTGEQDHSEVPEEKVSTQDTEQGDNGQNLDKPMASSPDSKPTSAKGDLNDFWTYNGDNAFPENGDEATRIVENNQDETQDNLIAMASGSSTDAMYFKGPRERWIRFQLPDDGFLPEKSNFTHGDTAVCFRISDRDIASKLSFEVFVTKANSKTKHELHPDNIVHSARLDFTLHSYGPNRPRCVQDFSFTKHFLIKESENADEATEVEYEDP